MMNSGSNWLQTKQPDKKLKDKKDLHQLTQSLGYCRKP